VWPSAYDESGGPSDLDSAAVKILIGHDDAVDSNGRRIRFMQFPEATMNDPDGVPVRDEWGNYYRFILDTDYNDVITSGPGSPSAPLNRICAAWSKGPDGIEFSADDVVSWRKK
jgi:hypothetical protein